MASAQNLKALVHAKAFAVEAYRAVRMFPREEQAIKEASIAIELAHAVDCIETSTFARLEAHGDEASRTLYGLMRYVDGCIKEGKTQRAL